jgi:hypothetical protein
MNHRDHRRMRIGTPTGRLRSQAKPRFSFHQSKRYAIEPVSAFRKAASVFNILRPAYAAHARLSTIKA